MDSSYALWIRKAAKQEAVNKENLMFILKRAFWAAGLHPIGRESAQSWVNARFTTCINKKKQVSYALTKEYHMKENALILKKIIEDGCRYALGIWPIVFYYDLIIK